MKAPEEGKVQSDILFCVLNRLYGDRFNPEREKDLRSAVDTVSRTLAVLRSVQLDQYDDPSLPFIPFRKEG